MSNPNTTTHTSEAASSKEQSVLQRVDWSHPALAATHADDDRANFLLTHLATPPRPRFRFEYERKDEILAFLHEHYQAWREFDLTGARQLESLT